MQHAYLRYHDDGQYIFGQPVTLLRTPTINEYIWLSDGAHRVAAVIHSWDERGLPFVTLDLTTDPDRECAQPGNVGTPQVAKAPQ